MGLSKHAETDTATHRVCSACNTSQPFTNYPRSKTGYAGYASRCRECTRDASRASRLQHMYSLTEDDYQTMLTAQGGRCAICGNRPRKVRLSVDHDHASLTVRGLLCARCNDTLGVYRDQIEVFQRFVQYLETPPAVEALGREHKITPEQEARHKRSRRSRVTRR